VPASEQRLVARRENAVLLRRRWCEAACEQKLDDRFSSRLEAPFCVPSLERLLDDRVALREECPRDQARRLLARVRERLGHDDLERELFELPTAGDAPRCAARVRDRRRARSRPRVVGRERQRRIKSFTVDHTGLRF